MKQFLWQYSLHPSILPSMLETQTFFSPVLEAKLLFSLSLDNLLVLLMQDDLGCYESDSIACL
jgi:hypothetical protein